ncbi:MAG: hypothetical protein RMH77_06305 [Sulfolobales archaeon]|nr:hypothetical protein [Sulfolobales archaeon]MDW7969996.1 hypothetical protein [Sulfolobales archaeon]
MRSFKGVKEVFIDDQLKLNIVDFGSEVFVSADVASIPWCYSVDHEISIDNVKVVYSHLEVPDVGKVEVVGSNVAGDVKVINVKYKVKDVNSSIHAYHQIIKYISGRCNEATYKAPS